MSNPLQLRSHRWTTAGLFAACVLLAILAEWHEFHFVFGISFSLVSFFSLLTVSLFGYWRGLFAAAIAGVAGVLLWHHPLFHLIGVLEVAFVGLLLRRYKNRLFGCAVAFWLLLGIPAAYLMLDSQLSNNGLDIRLIFIILALNGIFNALFAEIVQQYVPLRKWLRLGSITRPPSSIGQVLMHLTLGIVLGSFMLNMAINNISSFREVSLYANELSKNTVSTVVREWTAKVEANTALGGKLEHAQLQDIVDRYTHDSYTLNFVDRNHSIIASNKREAIGTADRHSDLGNIRPLFGSLSLVTPETSTSPNYLNTWQDESFRYVTELYDNSGWISVEVPVSNYINYLFNKYYTQFLYLIGFALLATAVALLVNRLFVRSLQRLAVSTTNLAIKLKQHGEWDRQESSILEVHSLLANFRHMASSLLHLFNESQENNEKLRVQADLLRQSEEKLQHLAYYDLLTELPNRLSFSRHVQELIENSGDTPATVAILFADINRFKQVNDTLGHSTGDRLLQMMAERLRRLTNESCTVFRLGGDEFVFVCLSAEEKELETIAQAICDSFTEPFVVQEMPLYLTASVGISQYPRDGKDMDTVIRNADIAMYSAKEEGDGCYRFFESGLDAQLAEKMQLENGLYKALQENQFSLHYQPKMSADSDELCGIEALIRWNHPELGLIPPDKFIPLAEKSGFIIEIDKWVFREACRQNKAWQDAGLKQITVSVNISARHFYQGNLKEMIVNALKDTGIDAQYVSLEITESVFMRNIDQVIETILYLRSLGIQISIDDFGTGYSSLNQLQLLPISDIKLDRSFIRGITQDEKKSSIVKAIIELVHSMNMKVVAEGVETMDESQFCKDLQCDELQGYLFSRPLPAGQFEDMLRSQR